MELSKGMAVTLLEIGMAEAEGMAAGVVMTEVALAMVVVGCCDCCISVNCERCLRKKWRSQFDLVVNRRGQLEHLYGFWPVCVRV